MATLICMPEVAANATQVTLQTWIKKEGEVVAMGDCLAEIETDKAIVITYSCPQLKGRNLETLVPTYKIWRTGANEAVEITFYRDVVFGGKALNAGTYSLFTIPSLDGDWTVIINSARNVWGSYYYKQDQDVIRVSGKTSTIEENIEAFSMMFDKDMTLKMGWGKTVVSVSIK